MFEISYYVNKYSEGEVISREDLNYNFLLGGVIFKKGTTKIEMPWDWIPLLDFAYSMCVIINNLKKENIFKDTFDFTESNDSLSFFKECGLITIIPSFSENMVDVPLDQLILTIKGFYLEIFIMAEKELINKNISLDLLKPFSFEN